jgi:hypothetical protein
MQKQGLDPNSNVDYRKFRKQQTEKVVNKPSQEEWVTNDSKDFTTKYPDVKFDDVFADKEFINYADKYHKDELGKSTPLSKIYSNYKAYQQEIEVLKAQWAKEAKDNEEKRIAKLQSSAGAISKTADITPKPYSKMSDAEFEKVLEKAKRGELKKN